MCALTSHNRKQLTNNCKKSKNEKKKKNGVLTDTFDYIENDMKDI